MAPVKLELPEILQHIARYLCTNDLTQCILVCKSWHQSFLPDIWKTVDDASHHPRTGQNQDTSIPLHSQDALLHHSHLVDTLITSMPLNGQYIICYPNLRTLSIRRTDQDKLESIEEEIQTSNVSSLIALNPTIVSLDFVTIYNSYITAFGCFLDRNPNSIRLWTSVSEGLFNLRKLKAVGMTVPHGCEWAFWDTCTRLERLDLQFSTIPLYTTTVSSMNGLNFDCIRQLELTLISTPFAQEFQDAIEQLEVIARCSQLEDLVWKAPSLRESAALEVSNRFLALAEARTWPRLEALTLGIPVQDNNLTSILASILAKTDMPMRLLNVTDFVPIPQVPSVICTLDRHFKSLTYLNVPQRSLTSPMHQQILCSCPMLDHFKGSDFAAKDALKGDGPWICTSIRVLNVQFIFGEDEDHLHSLIFRRLSNLIQLEQLDVAVKRKRTRNLDFRLVRGLGALDSLTKLRKLAVGFGHCLEIEDVVWMTDHWPQIYAIAGELHTDNGKRMSLRQHLVSAGKQLHLSRGRQNSD